MPDTFRLRLRLLEGTKRQFLHRGILSEFEASDSELLLHLVRGQKRMQAPPEPVVANLKDPLMVMIKSLQVLYPS
ncbi:hypothetical protein GOBAR_AA11325 [Gossypium barbadense]|uniref:Uncharacterized protein n=1 Tax=Gossypium barbadense TaxID=3634 RepID=A0A2P5Y164_GOSBA|nr:hypothetical protein GOBAR_AA11325 [Gossypium barbadense]